MNNYFKLTIRKPVTIHVSRGKGRLKRAKTIWKNVSHVIHLWGNKEGWKEQRQ